ncbi:MAG TPA: c-type cytochrome, partial [Myxococcales bacterium]|nr:c-type cytochrome [Myxococcales bacterium]
YSRANGTGTGFRSFTTTTFHPRGMGDAVVSPDGNRLFVPTVWAREDVLGRPPSDPGGGSSYHGGPCNDTGGVATAGLATFEVGAEDTTAEADDLGQCGFGDVKDFPPTTLISPNPDLVIQGPEVAALDVTGAWLFVVNKMTNNVAVLPAQSRISQSVPTTDSPFRFNTSGVRDLVKVGSGPTGIALTRDGKRAYVYNAFDHSISKLVQSGSGETATITTSGRAIKVADDVLPADVVAGRRLFFSATDTRMTATATGMACASCHLEGREDGHVWQFPDGPRQTPSLAGRMTTATAPFHWNGQFSTLDAFLVETVQNRMGGSGADTQMGAQLAAFIDSIQPPENVLKSVGPTDAQLRGAQVFQKAECNSCHGGSALTDNTFHDVGTLVYSGLNPDTGLDRGLNVPSLLGIARTGPYLHDGSASTLRSRIMASRFTDLHGKTSALSDFEIDDLVEYLKTL